MIIKKKIEFDFNDFKEIDKYCKKIGIVWFASAWDINSQIFLNKFKCKYNKIASSMLTNTQLLKVVAKEKKHTFISTGMSTLKNIKDCIKIFKKNKCKFTLLHCVSTYPCPEENLNLNMIITLKQMFKCPVGYSGHESSVTPSLMAMLLGAEVIERHITLDRAMWGTDQSASLSSAGLRNLSEVLSKVPSTLGTGKKIFSDNEKKMLRKFKYW